MNYRYSSGLNQALRLGRLGEQTVLISEKAFENLKFEEVELADKAIYYLKFIKRDSGDNVWLRISEKSNYVCLSKLGISR